MKLSARRGLECRIFHHLSQCFWRPWATPRTPAIKGTSASIYLLLFNFLLILQNLLTSLVNVDFFYAYLSWFIFFHLLTKTIWKSKKILNNTLNWSVFTKKCPLSVCDLALNTCIVLWHLCKLLGFFYSAFRSCYITLLKLTIGSMSQEIKK
jgi:hypothetical protein